VRLEWTELVSEGVRGLLWFGSCELLLSEAESRGQFGRPEEGERWPLNAAIKQQLVETVHS
jgi:hypothetical protein